MDLLKDPILSSVCKKKIEKKTYLQVDIETFSVYVGTRPRWRPR